ncbi:MAG: hypothetical protein KF819_15445 [Labilithrix sp.]|nr:hypothetical protein [Labilithrix sp.]
MSDLGIRSAIQERGDELASDIMWVRDDLRATLIEQSKKLERLQAVVWVLTQLAAKTAGSRFALIVQGGGTGRPIDLKISSGRSVCSASAPEAKKSR